MQPQKKTSFQDIRDEVLRRIQDRVWDQGALLPTEQELSEEFGCARATVNRALRELAERGIIDRKRKSGTRVAIAPVKQARLEITVTRQQVEDMNAVYR
ncbi:MAG: GntR family transcriptional regulator, partial [Phaeobacter gallaeciensis]